ncbi:hypothetical protein YC2023_099534 [Brassica napus]
MVDKQNMDFGGRRANKRRGRVEDLVMANKRRCSYVNEVDKSILLSLFTYHNSGCYNSPPLKELNVFVAPHDRSQDASQVRTEMANQL